MTPRLAFEDVTFEYSSGHRVVQAFSLELVPGEVGLLRGANGSGKTTLLRLAAGLLRPSRGRVVRTGELVHVPAALAFHETLTVDEQVRYLTAAGGLDLGAVRSSLERWGFDDELVRSEVSALSTGWRQRLAFALCAVPQADVVLLDEPLANLDAAAAALVAQWVRAQVQRGAVLLIAQHGDVAPLGDLPVRPVELQRTAA